MCLKPLMSLSSPHLRKWISRGKFGKYKRRRVLNKPVKIRYAKYLGKKYDLAFKFNNNKYYCSELIYDIYKDQILGYSTRYAQTD